MSLLAPGAFESKNPYTLRAITVFEPAQIKTVPYHAARAAARAGNPMDLHLFHSLVINCLGKPLEIVRQ